MCTIRDRLGQRRDGKDGVGVGKQGGGGWRDERNSDVLILFAIVVDSQQKVVTVGYLQSSSKFQTVIIHVIGSVSLGLLPLDLFPLGLFKWTYSHSTYKRRPELFISRIGGGDSSVVRAPDS